MNRCLHYLTIRPWYMDSAMVARYILSIVFAFGTVGLASCSSNGGGDNSNANDNIEDTNPESGAISGVVAVLAQETRTSIVEQEPNDRLEDLAAPISVESGTRLELFGELSVDGGDLSDSFLLQVKGDAVLEVQAILSFDFNPQNPPENDLAIGISDLLATECSFGVDDQAFTTCHDSRKNPEIATFQAQGEFGLTVQALAGQAGYVLGLEFSQTNGAASPRPSALLPSDTTKTAPTDAHRLGRSRFVPSEVLLKFEPGQSESQRRSLMAKHGLEILQRSPSGVYRCRWASSKSARHARVVETMRTIQALRWEHGVRVAEPNYLYYPVAEPNDEHFDLQWHYSVVNLPEAWDLTTGSEDIIIAVVDTGILGDHPDITDRLIPGYDFISDPTSARDGDGIDDDPTDDGDLSGGPGQSSYHGTHVTGIVGASTNNGLDIAGVTWGCQIMPLRALGAGGGNSFDIGEAVRYAAGIDNVSGLLPGAPADVINMSIATPAGSAPSILMGQAISEAVAKGVVVVAAAGNDASPLPAYPAGFADSIAVAACDPQLNIAPYSNVGATIDLTAPGGNLALDLTGDGFGDGVLSLMGFDVEGGVDFTLSFQHGTSMACPHVTGVVALMKSVNAELTVAEVREILVETAIDVGPVGPDDTFGAGVLNAAQAVSEAAARAGQATPTEPKISLSTQALDFGTSLDQLTIQVTNTGGGMLEITAAAVEELVGSGWLAATLQTGSGDSNVSGIIAGVDRNGLSNGTYLGRITVSAVGVESAAIDVTMRVGSSLLVNEILFVVAIDAETRLTIAEDVTSAQSGFAFEIGDLPPGTYKIYAGTDRDNDDEICDLGELCGGFPSAIQANQITVQSGQTISNIDFAVGQIVFEPQTAQRLRARAILLLD